MKFLLLFLLLISVTHANETWSWEWRHKGVTHRGAVELPADRSLVAVFKKSLKSELPGLRWKLLPAKPIGRVPGVQFYVSNDGGLSGVVWCRDVLEALDSAKRLDDAAGSPTHVVIALREPIPPPPPVEPPAIVQPPPPPPVIVD
jgi:hypothetical protein